MCTLEGATRRYAGQRLQGSMMRHVPANLSPRQAKKDAEDKQIALEVKVAGVT